MWFSNQLPVSSAGSRARSAVSAGDRCLEVPAAAAGSRPPPSRDRGSPSVWSSSWSLLPVVGQDRRDLGPVRHAVDEGPVAAHQVKIQAAQVLPFGLGLQEPGAAGRLGRLQNQRAVAQHRPVDPGVCGDQPAVLERGMLPAWTSATTTILVLHARPQRLRRFARGVGRIARHDAVGAPAVGVGRRWRGHAEDADAGPGGVDQAIGGEQALAVPAIEVGRNDRGA